MDGGVRRVTGDGGEGRSHPENSDGNHYREEDMIQITLQRVAWPRIIQNML